MFTNKRARLCVIAALAIQASGSVQASQSGSWNGVWNGRWNSAIPFSIRVANERAVAYKIRGTPFDIKYNDASPDSLVFGDPDHYTIHLKRDASGAVEALYHGRHGDSAATLKRVAP